MFYNLIVPPDDGCCGGLGCVLVSFPSLFPSQVLDGGKMEKRLGELLRHGSGGGHRLVVDNATAESFGLNQDQAGICS